MKKHLIVAAHPARDSFTMSLVAAYADELARLGHAVQIHDLYRMGFNPVLSAHELGDASASQRRPADVLMAQQDLLAADVVTAVYPLWWMSMPAMMKGYVDRVFSRGFAYESQQGAVRGLLTGRQAVMLTVSGAPLGKLVADGRWQAAQVLQDTHIFRAAGFELIEHLHFDEVSPSMSGDDADRYLARVREFVRERFAPVQSS